MNNNDNPMQDIQRIDNQYNSEHPLCRFQSVLYNKIPSSLNANCFDKPPFIRTQIWDQGIRNNPDRNKLVPVGICGYKQLNQRSNLCLAGHCSAIKRFQEISEKVDVLKDEIDIKTKQQITDLKQTQIHLSHRLLAILRCYICTITASQSEDNTMVTPKEMKLKHVMDQMGREQKGLTNLYGHINKLMEQINMEQPHGHNAEQQSKHFMNNNTLILNDCDHIDPQNMKTMFSFLKQQQNFLQLLAKTVQSDARDLSVIANGTQNKNGSHSPQLSTLLNNSHIY